MLVLTRKTGEAIVIGNTITLTVLRIGPGRVKIGINAPPEAGVDRGEVVEPRSAGRSGEAQRHEGTR